MLFCRGWTQQEEGVIIDAKEGGGRRSRVREEDIEAEVLLLVSALEIMMRDDDVRPIQMAVVII